VDAKEAARLGLIARPLTSANVQKHLDDVGLEPEFATHAQMRGLSGGQKVKVVIGAAMWNQPHLLVLDEPTNYLDRDSLGERPAQQQPGQQAVAAAAAAAAGPASPPPPPPPLPDCAAAVRASREQSPCAAAHRPRASPRPAPFPPQAPSPAPSRSMAAAWS
jgi:hypothetical protein